jgi:hypothetical protein
MVALMAFILLVPTLMVAVLVSGLSRRGAQDSAQNSAQVSDQPGADLGRLLEPDGMVMAVEVHENRAVA